MSIVLYRTYAGDGALLYIGATARLGSRLMKHNTIKPWWTEVNRIELEHFDTKEQALEAERRAISTENPRYNKCHWSRIARHEFITTKSPLDETLARAGFSTYRLSAIIRVPEHEITRWRDGEKCPPYWHQEKIARALNCEVSDLWPVAELTEHKERA